jgi:hypothetical protein
VNPQAREESPQAAAGEAALEAVETYSPEPSILERRFADYLAERGADNGARAHPSQERIREIGRVTRRVILLSALAGIVSGGLIGGVEIWMRQGLLDGMDDMDWRETLPYWSAFFAFTGLISAVEIALLYVLALDGIARITRWSGLPLAQGEERGLFAHGLARAALEFPSPQVSVYGIDPYARVSTWKLTALNVAYKLKVGVSSFILRVFLRRVAARMAIRSMVPLFAGPLYAIWNAYIVWRIMTEARIRTLGPFAVDNLFATHFDDAEDIRDREKDMLIQAAGEMMTRARDAHPNQIYLMTRLRRALGHERRISLDWSAQRSRIEALDATSRTRLLDLMTVSCLIGARIHPDQLVLLHETSAACGEASNDLRLKALHADLKRGRQVTGEDLAATRTA